VASTSAIGHWLQWHIGFNERPAPCVLHWIKILSEETLRDTPVTFQSRTNSHARRDDGNRNHSRARHCVVLACGAQKSNAVKEMIEVPSSAMCPASALQLHPRVTVITTHRCCRSIIRKHYSWIEQHKFDGKSIRKNRPPLA